MKHILVHETPTEKCREEMLAWFRATLGQQMFDADVLEHEETFVLGAEHRGQILAYLPVSRPLMMESLAFRPGLEKSLQALAMTRLAEHVVEQCLPRGAGEVYFLCQNPGTESFARRHEFRPVELPLYRFNLREWRC